MSSNIGRRILDNHKVNWTGIKEVLGKHGTFKKWPFWSCLSISALICILILLFRFDKTFSILQTISEITLSVFPNLLGFSLGGYAIVVGFSNTELIKKSTKTDKHSIYQILSAIFAISILFQVFTVLLSFAISFCIKIDINEVCNFYHHISGGIVNLISLFFLTFGALYSLVMTPYVVLNLFTLGQLNNMHYTVEVVKERQQSQSANQAAQQSSQSNQQSTNQTGQQNP